MKQFVADRLNRPSETKRLETLVNVVASLDQTIDTLYQLGHSGYNLTILSLNETRDKLQAEIDHAVKLAVSKAQNTEERDKLADWLGRNIPTRLQD